MTPTLKFEREVFLGGFCLVAAMTATLWVLIVLWLTQGEPASSAPLGTALFLVTLVDLAGAWLMWLALSQLASLVTFLARERHGPRPLSLP